MNGRPSGTATVAGRDAEERPDLRLMLPAVVVWLVTAAALGIPVPLALASAGLLTVAGLLSLSRPQAALVLVLAGSGFLVSALRLTAVEAGPVDEWAEDRAVVRATGSIRSDPVPREGRFGPFTVLQLRLDVASGRGREYVVRTPVLVIATDPAWGDVPSGARVRLSGRLSPSDGADLAAVLIARGPPDVLAPPGPVARAVNAVRDGLRRSVRTQPPAERTLVPALVVGDDRGMPADVADEFRATGLTHLLAVSGANLTLLLGFVLPVARLAGARAHGLAAVGLVTVLCFVLLARPDPSVLRAAAMGVVAMSALSMGGRRRGMRALGAAVIVLVLLDPWLARSVGFLLSVLATAAIIVLAPPWRDCLAAWMPRWLAEALAVPASAQLACTPVILAISGQVSLVAVAANVLAGPAVGPATVLGLLAALSSILSDQLASVLGWLAARAAWWIVQVADVGAALPGAAVPWPATAAAVSLTAAGCVVAAFVAPWVFARPVRCLTAASATVVLVVQPVGPSAGPDGWVMAVCDVGQGDAVVLNAGRRTVVVVDAGPDPEPVDRCLDRLDVAAVARVVLTHLHVDHVGGLAGVFDGRRVGDIQVGPVRTPAPQWLTVQQVAARHGVPVVEARRGEQAAVGHLRWTVLGPVRAVPSSHGSAGGAASGAGGDPESAEENDASIVLRAQAPGMSILLTGDVEPGGQRALLAAGADLDVDVLKVPHHGSRHQEPDFLAATAPALAVVSAGADNDYGHPAPETVDALQDLGATVRRTDRDGTVIVVGTPVGPAVTTLR